MQFTDKQKEIALKALYRFADQLSNVKAQMVMVAVAGEDIEIAGHYFDKEITQIWDVIDIFKAKEDDEDPEVALNGFQEQAKLLTHKALDHDGLGLIAILCGIQQAVQFDGSFPIGFDAAIEDAKECI